MPTIIQCSSCPTKLQAPDGAAAVKCPKCNAIVRVPGAAANPVAPKPPAAPPKPAAAPPKPAATKPAAAPPSASKPAAAPLKKAGPAPSKPPAAADKPAAALTSKARADAPPAAKKPAKPKKEEEADEAELEPIEEDIKEKRGSRVAPVQPGKDPFKGLGVPDHMKDGVREQLEEDEQIVWIGRAIPELMLKKARILWIVGFVLVALGAGSIIGGFFLSETIPLIGPLLFGIVLLLFSVLCFLAPWLIRRGIPSRPCYVITHRRAFIYYGGWMGVKSYDRRQLMTMMERRESRWIEGAGDLIFERTVSYEARNTGAGSNRRGGVDKKVEEHGFTDVADVHDVEKLIRNTIILRKATKEEEKADAEPAKKPAAEAKPKKAAKPAAKDDNIKSARSSGSWLTEDEAAELADGNEVAEVEPGGGRELIDDSELPDKLKARIHNSVYDDEGVIWVGQPHQKIIFMRSLFPAGFMLFFACVLGAMLLADKVPGGVATIIMCGAMALGGLLFPVVQRLKAHHTGYVLTSKRCLVFEPNFIGQVKATAYLPDLVSKMRRQNSWVLKGGGDLIFRTVTKITTTHYRDRRTGASRGSSTSISQTHYGFLAIDEVGRVERLINQRLVEPYLDRVHGV